MMKRIQEPSSFRDSSGVVFTSDGSVYRQINRSYKDEVDFLINSQLYDHLTQTNRLVKHEECIVKDIFFDQKDLYKVIKPARVPFISYPYEWCFSQLKDAALLTLDIQKESLNYGMSLKDASAYNIQFVNNCPILIDTLSFERYQEGYPWKAYKQFCQHFLAPLLLMSKTDISLNTLLKAYIDGIPLDLTTKLLPFTARFNIGSFFHIYCHSWAQRKYAKQKKCDIKTVSYNHLLGIIDSLTSLVKSLGCPKLETEWGDYYNNTNYSVESMTQKEKLVATCLDKVQPEHVIDLGANQGNFSRISSQRVASVLSLDIDPVAIEKNYLNSKKSQIKNILSLCVDLTNPTPAIGWDSQERMALNNRLRAFSSTKKVVVLGLALIHHLVISNGVPLDFIALYMSQLGKYLIIEFIPKEDSQVERLLSSREDVFSNYTQVGFEEAFLKHYDVVDAFSIENTKRVLYLMAVK